MPDELGDHAGHPQSVPLEGAVAATAAPRGRSLMCKMWWCTARHGSQEEARRSLGAKKKLHPRLAMPFRGIVNRVSFRALFDSVLTKCFIGIALNIKMDLSVPDRLTERRDHN